MNKLRIFVIFNLTVFQFCFGNEFTVGSGSEFNLYSQNQVTTLSIYIATKSQSQLGVEFYFQTPSVLMPQMWQHYVLERGNGAISVNKGFFKVSKSDPPKKMEKEFFNINQGKGVELTQFFFSNSKELEKDFVGYEQIEVIAGPLSVKHYRKKNNGQVVDYWISSEVKPIGLVKLVSKSETVPTQNYSIELNALIKNVKPEILIP